MNYAYLLTGGNMGDRILNLKKARERIETEAGKIINKSSLYETAAWGVTDQPPFLNQVLLVSTQLSATQLLQTLLWLELELGRKRMQKMGPRTIDIDILFYNNEIISLPDLSVPHPQIANRRFVLTPLNEIAANFVHPILRKNMYELLQNCPDQLEVKKFEM